MDNITISTPYDNTFTYYQNKTYMYQPDMSNGTLDDMVTAVNPVLLVCMYIVHGGRDKLLSLMGVQTLDFHMTFTVY